MSTEEHESDRPRWTLWVRWIIGLGATVGAATVSLVIVAVGHCSAFGGRCPAEPTPLLQDDVFGSVALISGLAAAIVGTCLRPDRRGVVIGVAAAIPLGLLLGYVATVITRG